MIKCQDFPLHIQKKQLFWALIWCICRWTSSELEPRQPSSVQLSIFLSLPNWATFLSHIQALTSLSPSSLLPLPRAAYFFQHFSKNFPEGGVRLWPRGSLALFRVWSPSTAAAKAPVNCQSWTRHTGREGEGLINHMQQLSDIPTQGCEPLILPRLCSLNSY